MSFNKRLSLGTPPAGPLGFKILIYSGNGGSNRSITGVGFQPDIIWIKGRNSTEQHYFYDSTRGASKFLHTNTTAAEGTDSTSRLKAFLSDGFKLGSDPAVNGSNNTYVAFCWKVNEGTTATNTDGTVDSIVQVNTDLGTSIVKFTNSSPGSNARIGHGLGSTPNMILLKRTDGVEDWYMYHDGMPDDTGNGTSLKQFMRPNKTNGQAEASNLFNTVNSTVFNPSFTGATNQVIIAYCFKNVPGYSHFGSYTGNGQANQAVDVGFSPDWILMKSTVGNDNWRMFDTVRGINNGFLEVDNSVVEDTTGQPQMAITSTGFSFTSGGVTQGLNANNNLVTYWAFKINE